MLERGWQRADRLLDLNGYIGPAPVSLQAYTEMVSQQSQAREPVSPESLQEALSERARRFRSTSSSGLFLPPMEFLFLKYEKEQRPLRTGYFGLAVRRAKRVHTPPAADKIFTLSSGKSEKIL